jgi:hypothetical protein
MFAGLSARIPSNLRNLGSTYARLSGENPHIAAALTGGGILGTADYCAQKITGIEVWDRERTLALSAYGFLYYGGPMKFFYLRYDRHIGPGRPLVTAFVDVCIHTPFFLLPCFYTLTGTIKGQSLSTTFNQFQNEWLEASFGSIIFWFPAQYLCFKYVPQHSRVVCVSFCSFFHKLWLSWVSNRVRAAAAAEAATTEDKAAVEAVEAATPP